MNAFFDLTNGLMLLFNLAALLIGILHFRRSILHKILCLYIAFALFQDMVPYITYLLHFNAAQRTLWLNASINCFVLLEGLLFYYYFFVAMKNRQHQIVLLTGAVLLLLTALVQWVVLEQFFIAINAFISAELFLLLVPCILYILEQVSSKKAVPVYNDPAFWTGAGIFIFAASSIPLFLGWSFSFPPDAIHDPIYSINNILYIILFTSLMIALRCKPSTQP